MRGALVASALVVVLLAPPVAADGPARATRILDWDTGTGKSCWIPALEIGGFVFALNQFDRHAFDRETYDTDGHTFWKNLRTTPVLPVAADLPDRHDARRPRNGGPVVARPHGGVAGHRDGQRRLRRGRHRGGSA